LLRYTEFDDGCPERLREAIRYSLLSPGKRLRPLLVLMAAEACGGEIDAALPAACAVEMVHTYSLIHDDLPSMDDDELRRGQPTLHVKFDEATAILAGDALIPLAFQIVSSEYPPSLATPCCLELAKACGATRLVGGQADDLAGLPGEGSELRRLEDIHRRKTGALLSVSLRLGGLVASADRQQHAALDAYGSNLGLAFQIVDDLLDCRGDWITMGKTTGKDDGRGRLTWPGLLGPDGAEQRARELIGAAVAAIACLGSRGQPLKSLAEFVLERNR
jgi:geranylgeranyl diphosphate synthase type II